MCHEIGSRGQDNIQGSNKHKGVVVDIAAQQMNGKLSPAYPVLSGLEDEIKSTPAFSSWCQSAIMLVFGIFGLM